MADIIHDQTAQFDAAADAQSIITMAKTHNETEAGLTAAFNQTATAQTITFDAAVDAQSLFTIAKSHNETETGLTSAFNTEFVSEIVFDIELSPDLDNSIGSFDAGGIPIIFYERTTPEPIIFYERAGAAEAAIFYARGETQRSIDQGTTLKFTAPYNFTFEQGVPVVNSTDAQSLITIAQTHDEAEAGLAAAFSTAVV